MARAAVAARRVTYEEYERLVDASTHSEWVDGEGTIFMPAIPRHAQIVMLSGTLLNLFADLRRLGQVYAVPFEMKLREGRSYRAPDLVVVLNQHMDRVDNRRLNGPADPVVEVLSADDPNRDRFDKYAEHEAEGVPEHWIVDGREGSSGAWLYHHGAGGKYREGTADEQGRLHSKVLPGFWRDPAWLAADPLPSVLECFRAIAPDAFGNPATSASSLNRS